MITDDEEYRAALKEASGLMNAPEGSPEGERLDSLADEIVAYEQKRWPMDDAK